MRMKATRGHERVQKRMLIKWGRTYAMRQPGMPIKATRELWRMQMRIPIKWVRIPWDSLIDIRMKRLNVQWIQRSRNRADKVTKEWMAAKNGLKSLLMQATRELWRMQMRIPIKWVRIPWDRLIDIRMKRLIVQRIQRLRNRMNILTKEWMTA